MDKFKAQMHKACGKGGIHCSCCNGWTGNHTGRAKRKLRKLARTRLKHETSLEFYNDIEDKIKRELGVKHVTLG